MSVLEHSMSHYGNPLATVYQGKGERLRVLMAFFYGFNEGLACVLLLERLQVKGRQGDADETLRR